MANYSGEYGHPYPRVDQYGYPVPPVDQYGNPIPKELEGQPTYGSGGIGTAPAYGDTPGYAVAPADYGTAGGAVGYGLAGAAYPHECVVVSGVVSPDGAAEYMHEGAVSGGLAPGETTAYGYEGVVGSGIGTGDHDHQLQPTREEHTTLGETLRRSGSSSSSSSSEDDGQGERRRRKKSIKERIKEKLPGSHKHEAEHKAAGHVAPAAGTGTETHAAGAHEKKGIMEKIKEKLPGHHRGARTRAPQLNAVALLGYVRRYMHAH